jgi:hypothetical protein
MNKLVLAVGIIVLVAGLVFWYWVRSFLSGTRGMGVLIGFYGLGGSTIGLILIIWALASKKKQ